MNLSFFHRANALLSRQLRSKLNRNVGWLTIAELVSRVGRILAAVILARQLDAVAFGVAAIALTVFELIRVFTENGIGAAVVRASGETFHRVANTAHRLVWAVCIGLAVFQLSVGVLLGWLMPDREVGLMVAVLALVFLIMPYGLLHAYCLIREQRMKHLAAVGSSQAVADHLLTAILALSGAGAWALVLPKLLTAPIWLFGVRHSSPWKRDRDAGFAPVGEIVRFSLPVLGSELLAACRDQLDKVLVSSVLGVAALGIYYFAFNAGLGVSSALNRAFSNAIYPHFCAASDRARAFRKSVLNLGIPLSLAYVAQAGAALIYVPIVFGEAWAHAAPLVAVICLGGPTRLIVDASRMYFRSEGRSGDELRLTLGLTLSILVPFAGLMSLGLLVASVAMVLGASLFAAAVTFAQLNNSHRLGHILEVPAP